MTHLQRRHPAGVPGAGQFTGIEHQYADVRLRMEHGVQSAEGTPLEGALAHARFMTAATSGYADSGALAENVRAGFALRAEIARTYLAELEGLRDTGQGGPKSYLDLAEAYSVRADQAEARRAWTKNAQGTNTAKAGEYRYLARTLRTLARGSAV